MKTKNTDTISSQKLREFGILMGAGLLLLFVLIPWLRGKHFSLGWFFFVCFILWPCTLLAPQLLNPLYKIWMKVAGILGFINTRILLSLVYFLFISPLGFFMKVFSKDPLDRKIDSTVRTYRVFPSQERSKMESPF